jgi:hypothetical protein
LSPTLSIARERYSARPPGGSFKQTPTIFGVDDLGGDDRELTPEEAAFLSLLRAGRPWLDVWRHEDANGRWVTISLDFTGDNAIVRTLRLDFDGETINGGWSPASLNWDSGVRAQEAGVDSEGADGLESTGPVDELARMAGAWFDAHRGVTLLS